MTCIILFLTKDSACLSEHSSVVAGVMILRTGVYELSEYRLTSLTGLKLMSRWGGLPMLNEVQRIFLRTFYKKRYMKLGMTKPNACVITKWVDRMSLSRTLSTLLRGLFMWRIVLNITNGDHNTSMPAQHHLNLPGGKGLVKRSAIMASVL